MKRILCCVILALALTCFFVQAMAANDALSGVVEARTETGLFAPIGGTVKTVQVVKGQAVSVGDVLYTLDTVKVYARQAGTVACVFGQEGDSIANLDSLYGGVLFMEPKENYTVSASTDKAYDNDQNRVIHVGETVYLRCYSDSAHSGVAVVTSVNGRNYALKVTEGAFELSETVVVYRDSECTNESRLGRGLISKTEPFAVTGTGSIVKMHAAPGAKVEKGDLLFETLPGEFDGFVSSGSEIKSTVSGVVQNVNVNVGGAVNKGQTAVTLFEEMNLWVAVTVPEADLGLLHPGDSVEVEYNWQDGLTVPGVVNWISAVGAVDAATGETHFTAYVTIEPDANTRAGLNVTVQPAQ